MGTHNAQMGTHNCSQAPTKISKTPSTVLTAWAPPIVLIMVKCLKLSTMMGCKNQRISDVIKTEHDVMA